MKVNLDPARGAGDILSVILCAPALNETHADGTHLGELIDGLKALID